MCAGARPRPRRPTNRSGCAGPAPRAAVHQHAASADLVQKYGQMRSQIPRIVFRAVNEAGLAPSHERQPHHVHARRIDHAAVVTEASLRDRAPARAASDSRGGSRSPRRRSGFRRARRSRRGALSTRVWPRAFRRAPAHRPIRRARSMRRCGRATAPSSGPPSHSGCATSPRTAPCRRAMPTRRPTSRTPLSRSAFRSRLDRAVVPTSCGDGTRRARTMSSTAS